MTTQDTLIYTLICIEWVTCSMLNISSSASLAGTSGGKPSSITGSPPARLTMAAISSYEWKKGVCTNDKEWDASVRHWEAIIAWSAADFGITLHEQLLSTTSEKDTNVLMLSPSITTEQHVWLHYLNNILNQNSLAHLPKVSGPLEWRFSMLVF